MAVLITQHLDAAKYLISTRLLENAKDLVPVLVVMDNHTRNGRSGPFLYELPSLRMKVVENVYQAPEWFLADVEILELIVR